MKEIAFLVDSSFIIPKSEENNILNNHIYYVPMIIIDPQGNEYNLPKISISNDKLLELFKKYPNKGLTTSITPKGLLEKKLSELLKEYDYVFCLPIAKALSNQYDLFLNTSIKDEYKGKVFVIGETNLPYISYQTIKKVKNYLENEDVINEKILENIMQKIKQSTITSTFIILTNLDRLFLSGRISKTKFNISKFINLKICLDMKKTGLVKFKIGRSFYKLFHDSIKLTKDTYKIDLSKAKMIIFTFGVNQVDVDKLLLIAKEFSNNVIYNSEISIPSIIATHLGTNSVAVMLYQEKD